MMYSARSIFLRITDRGVVSINRAVNADAVDVTVTEFYPGVAFGKTVTKRLWSRSPWWPEFAELLRIANS